MINYLVKSEKSRLQKKMLYAPRPASTFTVDLRRSQLVIVIVEKDDAYW
jgi:hypothetical protein